MEYWLKKTYTPDFVSKENTYIIEVKGFFRPGDTSRYLAIRDQLEEYGQELIFILQNPNKKVRKSNKITMGQWCDKNNIRYFTLDTIPDLKKYIGY